MSAGTREILAVFKKLKMKEKLDKKSSIDTIVIKIRLFA